jgi:hypothetical protein
LADPLPSRIVAHAVITSQALASALDAYVPSSGDGAFSVLGAERRYAWRRAAFAVTFGQGHVSLDAHIHATVSLPFTVDLPFDVHVDAEPVVSSEYAMRMQGVAVRVTSTDSRVAMADRVAGVYETIRAAIEAQVQSFRYDLRPIFAEAYSRLVRPVDIDLGAAKGCARLNVLEVESGPTVLADGIEKDIALVVAPSVTLPCSASAADAAPEAEVLPPLFNVAALTPGPFTITVPIVASYAELTQAMSLAFTGGKLFFSADYPLLYAEKPELYESQGALVLKLHIAGPVRKLGIDSDLDGDLYLVGHPAVVDNELRLPDLEPTIETRNFLLSLKAMTDADRIRDEARAALRLDIGDRLRDARDHLGTDLTFGTPQGCFRGDVDRIEVTGVHPHAAYLRVYVAITARARLEMPCASPAPSRAVREGSGPVTE